MNRAPRILTTTATIEIQRGARYMESELALAGSSRPVTASRAREGAGSAVRQGCREGDPREKC